MKDDKKLSIVFAGGGTGGHIFPVKSLIEFLYFKPQYVSKCGAVYRCGLSDGFEKSVADELGESLSISYPEIIKKLPFFFVSISSGKFRREKNLGAFRKNFLDLGKFFLGIFESFFFLQKNHIDGVFCKGGFVALPVVIAAKILGIKIFVHESDTTPGLVNRIASRLSTQNFSAFPHVLPHVHVVGQIMSDRLFDGSPLSFSYDTNKTLIVVTGGSQGAQTIYQTLYALFQKSDFSSFQFIIIGGTQNFHLQKMFEAFSHVHVIDFASQELMGEIYRIADIAITRGGTTSLAEQKIFGLKSLIIPLPWTHDQLKNAQRYHRHHHDVILLQDENLSLHLQTTLQSLQGYKKIQSDMEKSYTEVQHTKEVLLQHLLG